MEKLELKGKVKSVTIREFNNTKKENNKLLDTKFITFDSSGNYISERFGSLRKNATINTIAYYKHDSLGRILQTDRYKADTLLAQDIYHYNDTTNTATVTMGHSKLANSIIKHYNQQGQIIEEKWYKKNGPLITAETFKYDKNGLAIEVNRYSKDSSLLSQTSLSYNKKGFPIKSINTPASAKPATEITYRYKYDRKGNWIKKEILENIEGRIAVTSFTEREIEYY